MGKKHNEQSRQGDVNVNSLRETVEKDLIDRCTFSYEQTKGWIENADNKVSVAFGVFSAVFAAFSFLSEHYLVAPQSAKLIEAWKKVHDISAIISIVVMIIAVGLFAVAIIPNLKSNSKKPTEKKYPIFYGDISRMDKKTYKEKMLSGNEDDFADELIEEIYYNSKICSRKMTCYKCGVILSLSAIALSLIKVGAHFLMYQ